MKPREIVYSIQARELQPVPLRWVIQGIRTDKNMAIAWAHWEQQHDMKFEYRVVESGGRVVYPTQTGESA